MDKTANKIDKKTYQLIKKHLKFLKKFKPQKIILFGSRARGEHLEGSDVDLMVEFEPGKTPDLFEFIGIKN